MEAYFKMLEEAKRRDHRKIGAEMGLYVIDTEYVGPGLPLWLPKGAAIAEELEKLAKETEFLAGDRKSTRLNSSHTVISYAVFCLKKKKLFPPRLRKQFNDRVLGEILHERVHVSRGC